MREAAAPVGLDGSGELIVVPHATAACRGCGATRYFVLQLPPPPLHSSMPATDHLSPDSPVYSAHHGSQRALAPRQARRTIVDRKHIAAPHLRPPRTLQLLWRPATPPRQLQGPIQPLPLLRRVAPARRHSLRPEMVKGARSWCPLSVFVFHTVVRCLAIIYPLSDTLESMFASATPNRETRPWPMSLMIASLALWTGTDPASYLFHLNHDLRWATPHKP
ncbi:hypothetical protein MKEN_01164700 [Mycena kentingensis (nom. inval.)]|nr:hypothetical protein MKEN_01164700 [Mycena kentingensis (nom. inval.)]